jgi:hypothetical protein
MPHHPTSPQLQDAFTPKTTKHHFIADNTPQHIPRLASEPEVVGSNPSRHATIAQSHSFLPGEIPFAIIRHANNWGRVHIGSNEGCSSREMHSRKG